MGWNFNLFLYPDHYSASHRHISTRSLICVHVVKIRARRYLVFNYYVIQITVRSFLKWYI